MDAPKVAVIGAGYWGKNIVRGLGELGALGAICDSSRERLDSFRESHPGVRTYESLEGALSDKTISAVAIASPAELHGDMAMRALYCGKDVYVEKPVCLSEKVGEELVALAKKKGAVLMVGHLLHYHPAVAKLKELAASGELGRIYHISSNRLNLGKFRAEENVTWSFAPHDISVILSLTGEMPSEVASFGGSYVSGGVADVTLSVLGFPSGAKANIYVSWLHPYKEQKLVVVGSRMMAVFDDVQPQDKLVVYPHVIESGGGVPVPDRRDAVVVPLEKAEPLKEELSHFIDCVAGRKTPRTDGNEGLGVLRVLQACQESLDGGGRRVRVAAAPPAYFAHPSACVDAPAEIGEGTRIWHFSHVMKGAKIGRSCTLGQNVMVGPGAVVGDNVKIQNNVSVYDGVTLEDGVFCGPSMVFTNVMNPRSLVPRKHEFKATRVGRNATLGANCTVVCGNNIGSNAFVGAGAVVTKDVPDYALVVGNPARVTGYMCECGVKLDFDADSAACGACGAAYEKNGNTVKRR